MNILVGITARPESRAALEWAAQEASLRNATLNVIRTMVGGLSENPAKAEAWASEVDQAQQEGDELVRSLASRGIDATFHLEVGNSDPATTLLDAAREFGAELIVVGIRRRSPVGKLVLGSVSQDVLLGADCPVVAVKADEE